MYTANGPSKLISFSYTHDVVVCLRRYYRSLEGRQLTGHIANALASKWPGRLDHNNSVWGG